MPKINCDYCRVEIRFTQQQMDWLRQESSRRGESITTIVRQWAEKEMAGQNNA